MLIWVCGLCWFGRQIQSYNKDTQTKTDALIVLTGGRNRITEAMSLLHARLAPKLFISGVSNKVTLQDIMNLSQTSSYEADSVELGYKATNTIENASEIVEWIEDNNIKSIRLITSNYHIPRSLAELRPYNLNIKIIVHPVYSQYINPNWWKSWGTFKFIVFEYNKFLFVWLRNLF